MAELALDRRSMNKMNDKPIPVLSENRWTVAVVQHAMQSAQRMVNAQPSVL